MKYKSTNQKAPLVTFKEAIFSNLAPDGGLYLFEKIPAFTPSEIAELKGKSFQELSLQIAKKLLSDGSSDSLSEELLKKIITTSLTFTAPVAQLAEDLFALELFHGPTHAFKDFAAQFMAKLMVELRSGEPMTILVATSGDTGSAVAQAFWNLPNVNVVLLFPKGYVSPVQKAQLTSFDNNVTALECEGNFDDCQKLVKTAFMDEAITKQYGLVSANSINLARLIPQVFYYFSSYFDVIAKNPNFSQVIYSVPSGNFGDLTAGVIAKQMGLPILRFIAATNENKVVPEYLKSGEYQIKPLVHTISNAMDVANPSNFIRIQALHDMDHKKIQELIFGVSFSDAQTKAAIKEIYQKYNYVAEPHSAIGYLGAIGYPESKENLAKIFLCTAHPAKFPETVNEVLGVEPQIPETLAAKLSRPQKALSLQNSYEHLKETLAKTLLLVIFTVSVFASSLFTALIASSDCLAQDVYLKKKPTTVEDSTEDQAVDNNSYPSHLNKAASDTGSQKKESELAKQLRAEQAKEQQLQNGIDYDLSKDSSNQQILGEPLSRDEELIVFELELAKKNYQNKQEDLNLSALITALRKAVVFYCDTLKADLLQHFPEGGSPKCSIYIDEILKLDPYDQIAVCAKFGYQSQTCITAANLVETKEFAQSELTQNELLELELETQKNEQLLATQQDAYNTGLSGMNELNSTLSQEAAPQDLDQQTLAQIIVLKKQFQESAYKVLAISCKRDKYFVKTIPKPTPTPAQTPQSPLSMELFKTATPKSVMIDSGGFKRYRLLSNRCVQILEQIALVDPNFSTAVCTRAGNFTPRCIEAKKQAAINLANESKVISGGQSLPPQGGGAGGMAEF